MTPFRQVRARPRLFVSILFGLLLFCGLSLAPVGVSGAGRVVIAFDGGALNFLILTCLMMIRSDAMGIRARALTQDEGEIAILILAVGGAVFSLTVIGVEMHDAKSLPPARLYGHLALVVVSILCSWFVTHVLFALHYAHAFYDPEGRGDGAVAEGLDFPGKEAPDYWDFLYFSFVIGMTCQVSDVQITSRGLRRAALAQGVLSFFVNLAVLGMCINIVAGLI